MSIRMQERSWTAQTKALESKTAPVILYIAGPSSTQLPRALPRYIVGPNSFSSCIIFCR